MTLYFGTDGVRGVANREINTSLAMDLGRYGAYFLAQRQASQGKRVKILIGRDPRISGEMLEAALSAGVCSVGVDVELLGVVPTAAVAYLVQQRQAAAGIVISASHNPAADNGIKFFAGDGHKLPDEVEEGIEQLLLSHEEVPLPIGAGVGRIIPRHDLLNDYIAYLKKVLSADLQGLKIVIDGANGAASLCAPELLRSLGAEVVAINCSPDGLNINDECGSTSMDGLCRAVLAEKADVGLAFDGDADRLLAVDEQGKIIDGDQLMLIAAKDLQAKGRLQHNLLVVTILSNMGLRLAAQASDIVIAETQVGDRYVNEKMQTSGACLGGEQSGHIIFSDYNTTGDGLVTALFFAGIIAAGHKASQLAAQMTRLPQLCANVKVRSKEGWAESVTILKAIEEAKSLLGNTGRLVVRPSGTERLLRVMAEGQDEKVLRHVVDLVAGAVTKELGDK